MLWATHDEFLPGSALHLCCVPALHIRVGVKGLTHIRLYLARWVKRSLVLMITVCSISKV